jgi:adenylylsulfate kinase-like enzyme
MKNLTIYIAGHTNSGKSTVAQLVAQALLTAGFNVEVQDEVLREGWLGNQEKRVEALTKGPHHIKVQTVQLNRHADIKNADTKRIITDIVKE